MRISHRRGVRAGFGAAMLALALPAAADHHMKTHWSGDLGAGYDDNVGSAALDTDTVDSAFVSAGVSLDHGRRLSSTTGLLLRGSLRGDAYEAAEGLSSGKLTGLARLSHRAEGGFYMPTLAGWLSASLWEFDSALRDSADFRAGVYLTEPLTTALSARLGVQASERQADSAVFDLSSWSAAVNVDWNVLGAVTLYGGYQLHDGELVSSGSVYPKNHEAPAGDDSVQYEPDDALDGLTAYRVEAQTQIAVLGANLPVSERLSFDAQLQQVESETDYGIGYSRMIGSVSALMRF
jgi:hypothetical protein